MARKKTVKTNLSATATKAARTFASRLRKLANFALNDMLPSRFNMSGFLNGQLDDGDEYDTQVRKELLTRRRQRECGTTCCFMGMTPLVFPSRFEYSDRVYGMYDIKLKNHVVWSLAGMRFFGLSGSEFDHLFFNWDDKTRTNPKLIAQRAFELVEKKNKEKSWPHRVPA